MASFNHISGAEPSTVTFKLATVVQTRNSTAMHQEILSIGDPESSLALAAVLATDPLSTTFGIVTRPYVPVVFTTASTSALASTSLVLQSSAALLRSYVCAYSITSTMQLAQKMGFYSGSTMMWPLSLAALSSAVTGANLAVGPPGYLFRTKVAGPLSFNAGTSTVSGVRLAVSYFRAP